MRVPRGQIPFLYMVKSLTKKSKNELELGAKSVS